MRRIIDADEHQQFRYSVREFVNRAAAPLQQRLRQR
jgi:hypothetical protein